jgi:hypothetical protein
MTNKREIQRGAQQDKILRLSQEVFALSAEEAGELAFMSKCFIQATLPHSDPGDVAIWGRRSGDYSLSIQPGIYLDKKGKPVNIGVPFGSIPRLILAWANGEVVRTGSRELLLGKSFSEFLGKMGYESRGGIRGEYTRVRSQAQKLFSSRVSMVYDGNGAFSLSNANFADHAEYFWDPIRPEQRTLWDSKILLSESFFNMLKAAPVPLDWRVLKAIKQSPMALDLYMFLSYRMFTLKKPQKIKWETFAQQFGSNYKTMKGFRENVRKHYRKVQAVWQDLKLDLDHEETLTLYPSRLLIASKRIEN